jgi:hypothetical protein
MKIRLLRASNTVKQIEFAAILPPLEIQRLSVDLMFENFETNRRVDVQSREGGWQINQSTNESNTWTMPPIACNWQR